MRHPIRIRQMLAAAAATLALAASSCASEAPPPRAAPATTVAPEAPPSTSAAREEPSACEDPAAQDLGDGFFERDGIVYELMDEGNCLPRLRSRVGPDVDEGIDDERSEDAPEQSADTAAPSDETADDEQPEEIVELLTRPDAMAAIIDVFEAVSSDDTPSFEECRLLSNGEAIDLTPEQQAACIEPLMAVLEACALLGCAELGLLGGPAPEPEPTTTTTEPPTTTIVPEPEPEPESEPVTTTTVPEPELGPVTTTTVPEPEPEPEPEPTAEDLAAARGAFNIVYSSDSPFAAVAVHLEDAAALEDTHAQFVAFGANVGGVEITATDAAVAADRTDRVLVTFEVYVAGVSIPVTGRNISSVWLVDGTWIVSRGAFCNAMTQLEIICPPVGGQPEPEWVEPHAGYVPPVHSETPALQGELGPEPGNWKERPADEPRATGEDRKMVAAWIAWAGLSEHTRWLLFNMKWALDYLGASPQCVINEYYDRVDASRRAAASAPGRLEPYELRDLHGWHNCATVIDPYLIGVELPADRSNDAGLRLSDTPGVTLAERCRAVLPPDVQLEKSWYQQRGPDGNSIFAPPPEGYRFEEGHAGCDAWAAWYTPSPSSNARIYPACYASARLAEEWMEHYRGLPEHYGGPTC